jgi:hypothetical protein
VPPYDPDVIERFAARLERRAVALRRSLTVLGGAFGALVGSVPLTSLNSVWDVPHFLGFATTLSGMLVGGLVGYVVGDGRAEIHRLHAQTTLCQLHAQRTSLAIWRFLHEQPLAPAAAPPVSVPAPVPAPAPAPVFVAPPAPQPFVRSEPEPEPEREPAPLFQREAVRLASVPTPPSVLRPAGIPSPPVSPPPLTG